MRNVLFIVLVFISFLIVSCSQYDIAQMQYEREKRTATYQSEYAKSVNKLEMSEGNFKNYRRIVFYNVRRGETVFCCEGYCHVQIDTDGDIELVVKTGNDSYLRH